MKLSISLVFIAAACFASAGCKDPGDANAMRACKDKACIDQTFKDHAESFPEAKMNLKDVDMLDEKKKAQLSRAVECTALVAGEKK